MNRGLLRWISWVGMRERAEGRGDYVAAIAMEQHYLRQREITRDDRWRGNASLPPLSYKGDAARHLSTIVLVLLAKEGDKGSLLSCAAQRA